MVGCGWISNRHITPQLYLPWGALAGRSPSGGYTGVATADPVPGTCNIEVIYQLSALVFDMGQPAGVHAPTWTLTHQNPYPPTKGTGCSHGSKGLNLQWVNPRDELDKTYYYSYIVTMTQLCNGASGWTNMTGGTLSPSSPSVCVPAGWTSRHHHHHLSLRQH